jgi:hypothetical protein
MHRIYEWFVRQPPCKAAVPLPWSFGASGRRNAMRLPAPRSTYRRPPVPDRPPQPSGERHFPWRLIRPPDRSDCTAVRLCHAVSVGNSNRTTPVIHRVTGWGATAGHGVWRRAAATRASVSAVFLPLFLAVPGLDGHSIARPAPASHTPHRTTGLRPAWTLRPFGPLGCAAPRSSADPPRSVSRGRAGA